MRPPSEAIISVLALGRIVPVGTAKVPLIKAWPARATSDLDQVLAWQRRWPWAMLATMTGEEVVVVDVDTIEGHGTDGAAGLAALEAELGDLPPTVKAATPSGGRHLYFRQPPGRKITSGNIVPGVDLRGHRALAVVPPSRRRDGLCYAWLRSPTEHAISELPHSWLEALAPPPRPRPRPLRLAPTWSGRTAYAEAALRNAVQRVATAPQGQRNMILNREAWSLGRLVAAGDLHDETVWD